MLVVPYLEHPTTKFHNVWDERQSLSTATFNGPIVPAPDNDGKLAWSIGGMITGKKIPKNLEKNLSQCHTVHHRSYMDSPESEPGPPK